MKITSVYITGDTHGELSIGRLSPENFPEGQKLTKNDLVIVLGDFGLFFYNDKDEKKLRDWITQQPFQIAFVDGNHENHEMINKFPTEDFCGGKVGVYKTKYGKIIHLKRGEIYTFCDKKFLVVGGALSVDKHLRSIGFDYWPEETLNYSEEKYVQDKLDTVNWNVDYVLTHTCPYIMYFRGFVNYKPYFPQDPVATFFDFIEERLNYSHWYFGHLHVDKTTLIEENNIGDFTCVFNDIIKLVQCNEKDKNCDI